MLTATIEPSGSVLVAAVALLLSIAGILAAGVVFLSHRQQATSALQSDTIAALEAANNEKSDRIGHLEEKNRELEMRLGNAESRLIDLAALVTQRANVDQLRGEVDEAFQILSGKLDRLLGRAP